MAGTKVTNHSDHRMREGQPRRRPLQVLLCAWPLVALAAVSEDETQSFPQGAGRVVGTVISLAAPRRDRTQQGSRQSPEYEQEKGSQRRRPWGWGGSLGWGGDTPDREVTVTR